MKKFFYWLLIAFLVAILAVEDYERRHPEPPIQSEVVDSVTTTEEKPDTAPTVRDSVVLRYQYVEVPLTPPPQNSVSTSDSSAVRETVTDELKVEKLGDDSVSISIPELVQDVGLQSLCEWLQRKIRQHLYHIKTNCCKNPRPC